MLKPRFLCFIATAAILCLILFTACQEPANNDTDPDNTAGTWVEFRNLEQFPVTIYSDPARQVVFAEVSAKGTKKVVAVPNSAGTAFYPTFKLDLFKTPGFNFSSGISVPYNGSNIIAVIEADKTNTVSISKLTSVETNSAYIKLTNNSNFSLTLRQGNAEKSPLGGGSTVISAGRSAAYEIAPGAISSYSIMHNTTTPVAFPAGLTEFKAGIIYALTYNGTTLTLDSIYSVRNSVLSTGVIVPGNSLVTKLDWLKNNAGSNKLYDIEIYTDENIGPQTLSYSNKSDITITMSGIDTHTVNLSSSGSLFTIGSGVTLILDNNITLNGRNNNAPLVHINSGRLVMNMGSKIIGNSSSGYNGGGVYVENGTFTMNGGEISSNTSSNIGGGVNVVNGTFIMNGGKISGNTAKDYGGGVSVSTKGTFTMKDGEISGNTATTSGGGVFIAGSYNGSSVSYGTFRMSGGVIYGNNATAGLANTAASGAVLSGSNSQYGTFSGDTFYKSGDLTTTDTTIRIVNGNLLTE
jgi:hypothetical protein